MNTAKRTHLLTVALKRVQLVRIRHTTYFILSYHTSEDSISEIERLSPLGMSDHCILKFACQQKFNQYKNQDKLRLDIGDYKQFREFLNVDWDDFLKDPDNSVDDMWEKFKIIIQDGIKQFIPTSRRNGKIGNIKNKKFS